MRAGLANSVGFKKGIGWHATTPAGALLSTSRWKCATRAGASASFIFIRPTITGFPVCISKWRNCRGAAPAEEFGAGTLAGAGSANHRDVKRERRLLVEERAETVAHQRGGQTQRHRLIHLLGMPAAMLLQPAKVFGQLARQSTSARL